MDEIQDKTALPVAPEEEIIEKKPFHPVETSLTILCFLILCFAIYLVCDELGFYADAERYNTGVKASDEYLEFARGPRIQMQKVNEETIGLDELKNK